MKRVTTYHEGGRTFYICKDSRGYWGIENKYVDPETGRLTIQLNGITGFHSATISETLEKVSNKIKVDYLVSIGMDSMKAACIVIGGITPEEYDKRIAEVKA